MKKKLLTGICSMAFFFMLIWVVSVNGKAATITEASDLGLPSATYTGTFVEGNNSARYYKVTITEPSCLNVDLMAEFYQRILLTSAAGDELYTSDRDINDSGTSHQQKSFYLDRGTYYLGFGALTGLFVTTDPYGYFQLTTSVSPVAVMESEVNDSMLTADALPFSQNVTGMFSVGKERDKDFYYLTLNKSRYTLFMQSAQSFEIGIYTQSGDEKLHRRVSVDSKTNLATMNEDITLEAGTYYVMVTARNSGEYGTYTLNLGYSTFAPDKPGVPRADESKTTSVSLSWSKVKEAEGYEIYQKKGSKYQFVLDTTDTKAVLKKLKSGTGYSFKIRAYVVVNGHKNYSPYSDVCKTATKPKKTSISSIQKLKRKKSGSGYYYRATVKWKKASGATSYKLYCRRAGSSYKSYIGTYKKTKATVSLYWSRYSRGSKKYTYYVVPVKKYAQKEYIGAYSKGKSYKFK